MVKCWWKWLLVGLVTFAVSEGRSGLVRAERSRPYAERARPDIVSEGDLREAAKRSGQASMGIPTRVPRVASLRSAWPDSSRCPAKNPIGSHGPMWYYKNVRLSYGGRRLLLLFLNN